MKIVRHTSNSNPYGYGLYFCESPADEINNPPSKNKETDSEYCDILRSTLNHYREAHASRLLHEIAHSIFSSGNPEKAARMFFCAGEMYTLLKNIADRHEICTISDIHELLEIIDGKDD